MNQDKPESNQTTQQSLFLQHSHNPAFSRPKTTKTKRKHQSHSSFDYYHQTLWKQSPTSLTRDRAPSHRIPKAQRFGTTQLSEMKGQQALLVQENDAFNKAGVSFCKSIRPDHFLKEDLSHNPSPSAYNLTRFLDKTSSKCKTEKSLTLSPDKKSTVWLYQGSSEVKGGTMNNFFKHHKTYVAHSKNRPYQPQNTIDYPGPNHYVINWSSKRKEIKQTFRLNLRKFHDIAPVSPGPSQYKVERQKRSTSFNVKGTFPQSNRTYLSKPKQGPASNQYNIPRFLQHLATI